MASILVFFSITSYRSLIDLRYTFNFYYSMCTTIHNRHWNFHPHFWYHSTFFVFALLTLSKNKYVIGFGCHGLIGIILIDVRCRSMYIGSSIMSSTLTVRSFLSSRRLTDLSYGFFLWVHIVVLKLASLWK